MKKKCSICGNGFDARGNSKTCSAGCSSKQRSDYMRKFSRYWARLEYRKDPEKHKAIHRVWRAANPEKAKRATLRWRERNSAHYKKTQSDYRIKNWQHIRSLKRENTKQTPDWYVRAKLNQNTGLTPAHWSARDVRNRKKLIIQRRQICKTQLWFKSQALLNLLTEKQQPNSSLKLLMAEVGSGF